MFNSQIYAILLLTEEEDIKQHHYRFQIAAKPITERQCLYLHFLLVQTLETPPVPSASYCMLLSGSCVVLNEHCVIYFR